ncbi:MAG: CBS domain-containing protein, partial [Halobacteriovoraceae bacterium]|nr:CBS domain-containing protein [Halobacteriovoraceae bacterium]
MKNEHLEIAVDEFGSPIISFATTDMSLEQMIDMMQDKGFRHLPVLERRKPIGMISCRDLLLLKGLNQHFDLKASDVMVENPYCVPSGTSIGDVAFEMSQQKIGSAIIVDDKGCADSIFT